MRMKFKNNNFVTKNHVYANNLIDHTLLEYEDRFNDMDFILS